jgi:hypothetical protein
MLSYCNRHDRPGQGHGKNQDAVSNQINNIKRRNMKDLKELQEKYRQLGEEIEKLKGMQELIPVPENIKIHVSGGGAIAIVNGTQRLWQSGGTFGVALYTKRNTPNVYLKKVDRSEIKMGDVFYRSDSGTPQFKALFNYAVALEDGAAEYCYWDTKDARVSGYRWKHYYKVVTKEG